MEHVLYLSTAFAGMLAVYYSEISVDNLVLLNPLTYYALLDPVLSNFGIIERDFYRNIKLMLLWFAFTLGSAYQSYFNVHIYISCVQYIVLNIIIGIVMESTYEQKRVKNLTFINENFKSDPPVIKYMDYTPHVHAHCSLSQSPPCFPSQQTEQQFYDVNKSVHETYNTFKKASDDQQENNFTTSRASLNDGDMINVLLKKYSDKLKKNDDLVNAKYIDKFIDVLEGESMSPELVYSQLYGYLTGIYNVDNSEENLLDYLNLTLKD